MKIDWQDGERILYNIFAVTKDILRNLGRFVARMWKKHFLSIRAVLSLLALVMVMYWSFNPVLDFFEKAGMEMVETRVVTDKIQSVVNGNTRYYLVSGNGQVLPVGMSEYLSTKVGESRTGMWSESNQW